MQKWQKSYYFDKKIIQSRIKIIHKITTNWNLIWKELLIVLWENIFIHNMAPKNHHIKDNNNSTFSFIRQYQNLALNLSNQKTTNATILITIKYIYKISIIN